MKNNFEYKRLSPFKLWVCQNFPFIDADFDAITEWQLFGKISEKMNEIITSQNQVGSEMQNLAQSFNSLYDYVMDYFENLDVQDEINNKLNQMVESGEFARILNRLLYFNEYMFHTLFATEYYRNNDELYGMQGGCVLPDGSIIICTGNNNASTGKILHYGTDGTLLNSKTVDYGHCNGVTYCDETDSVFITSTQSDTLGRYMIYEIDKITLNQLSSEDLSDKEFPSEPYGIVYIKELNNFIFCNYWNTNSNKYLWRTDLEFNILKQNTIDINVRSTSNMGRFGDYIGINIIGSHKVLTFDFTNLEFIKENIINELVSDTWFITEVEWFDTRNNNIYLGFIPHSATSPRNWGGGTKVVAFFNPFLNYQETGKQVSEFPPHSENYYVNSSVALNVKRDGSSSAPFRNIYEALNSALRTKNVSGDVTITLQNDENNDYTPIFSMNKAYKIYKTFENPFNSIGALAVANKANVYFRGKLILKYSNLINVYGLGNAHIQNRGYFYVSGEVEDNENNKIILASSSDSKAYFALRVNGMDASNMYGDFYNLYNGLITDGETPFVNPTGLASTYNNRRIHNINLLLNQNVSDQSFQIPTYCDYAHVTIRLRYPNTVYNERVYTWVKNQYQSNLIEYKDSQNNNKHLDIIINGDGKITFTPIENLADFTTLRVKFQSC